MVAKVNKKTVVIVESSVTDMFTRISRVLRSIGYETVLITMIGDPTKSLFYKKSFDKVFILNLEFLKVNFKNFPRVFIYLIKKNPLKLIKILFLVKKLNPYVVIARATPNWMCFLVKNLFRKYPFIYFPYDIRSFAYDDLKDAINSGIPRFEILAERYCFENSDGIIHKGHEDELKFLDIKVLGKKINIRSPVLHFFPYCLDQLFLPIDKNRLSKNDGKIHIAFVGHVGSDDSFVNSVNEIIKHKMHLHLYARTINLTREESYNIFRGNEYKNLVNSKYLHVHPQLDQDVLAKELTKYDYGFWLGYYDSYKKITTLCTGNKIANYFEAGIPFFYFKNNITVDKLMNSYGLGFCGLQFEDIKNLRDKLKKVNYDELVKKVEWARQDFEVNKHIHRLIKFFEDVRKFKYDKNLF